MKTSFTYRLVYYLFPNTYWQIRLQSWTDCEAMVSRRIREQYPNIYKELWKKLVQ